MYPEIMVVPMREELTSVGVVELQTPTKLTAAKLSRGPRWWL